MDDRPIEWRRGETSSPRIGRVPISAALALIRAEHWGAGLTEPLLARAVAHSLCFGLGFTPGAGDRVYLERRGTGSVVNG